MKHKLPKILLAGAAVAAVIGFTVSYFKDTETSAGNKFVAGKFNLQVGSQCTYNGDVIPECNWLTPKDLSNELFFNLVDVKPGDYGENTLRLKVDNNDAWMCAELLNVKNFDNGCEKPESDIDTTCGTGLTDPGEGLGELQNNLFLTVWKDLDCNNILNQGETKIIDNAPASSALWPIADSSTGSPITGGTTACYGFSWNVPLATSNIIQTDSLQTDLRFTAVQSRHMDTFTCSQLYTEVCDGVDNDYDQAVDEGPLWTNKSQVCSVGVGQCNTAGTYTCDPGNSSGPTVCSATASNPGEEICGDSLDNDCDGKIDEDCQVCGNGEIEEPENCDDANTNPGDGCSATCQIETGFNCTGQPSVCTPIQVCGNGIVEGTEQCDDGNQSNFDFCSTSCIKILDKDLDGYAGNDCNDSNPAIYPGAPETCNGFDDDCDGSIDEGVKNTYYRDADGDGYGNPVVTTQSCITPAGYVSNWIDCNDANAAVHPGATEVCNGLDDDCDGVIDENGPSLCNDGLYCNGTEMCSAAGICTHTGNPCPGPDGDNNCQESCNEAVDNCTANDPNGVLCSSGYCSNGVCMW